MLRSRLFLAAALLSAGAAFAQVTDDPQAVAPVVYSDAPAARDCTAPVAENPDERAAPDCRSSAPPADQADEEPAPDEEPLYAEPDYVYDDGYYPGVTLAPYYDVSPWSDWGYGYWDYGWGWPYYGYAPYGYWSGFGFAYGWGGGWRHHGWHGGHDHDHHGGHDHDGHGWHGGHGDHGHAPYRYVGNGRYWDDAHPSRGAFAGTTGAARTMDSRTTLRSAPARGGYSRTPLPSASYYVGRNPAATMTAARRAPIGAPESYRISGGSGAGSRGYASRGYAVPRGGASGGRNSYWVTSLPSRGYAPAASRAGATRFPAYGSPRGYAPQRGYSSVAHLPQNAYSGRGYSMSRQAPSYGGYSGGRGGYGGYGGRSFSSPRFSGGGGHAMPSSHGGGGHGSSGRAR